MTTLSQYWQFCQGSCQLTDLEGAMISSEKDQHDYETQLWGVRCHLGLTLFLDRLQRDCTWLHIFNWAALWTYSPWWKCQGPAKQGERNKLGQGYGKRSMYLAYWECRGEKKNERKCSSSLWLQVIKDGCYVCDAIELWQPKLVSLSNKDFSVFFSSRAGNKKPSVGYQLQCPEVDALWFMHY